MSYVLDTCVFNWLLDGKVRTKDLPDDGEYLASHVQFDEIANTPDDLRREELLRVFRTITDDAVLPTESFVIGVSRLNMARLSNGRLYEELKSKLDARNNGKRNNARDALIAETAIVGGHTLVTADVDLSEVAQSLGCSVLLLESSASVNAFGL